MLKEGFIRIGSKEFKMTKDICEEKLGGKWMGTLGCIVNSRFKYEVKNNQIYIAPEGSKQFPVLVGKKEFENVTGRGGRLADMHTYLLG